MGDIKDSREQSLIVCIVKDQILENVAAKLNTQEFLQMSTVAFISFTKQGYKQGVLGMAWGKASDKR